MKKSAGRWTFRRFRAMRLGLEDEVDPLNLLDPQPAAPPRRKVPTAEELNTVSPWAGHYRPPDVVPPPAPTPPAAAFIGADPRRVQPAGPEEVEPEPDEFDALFAPLADACTGDAPAVAAAIRAKRCHASTLAVVFTRVRSGSACSGSASGAAERTCVGSARASGRRRFSGVLAGAGLEGVAVTPELARSFGEILHVVVSGVMDVLKARHQIKDEFRMRMTHLRVADNNPLKFSVDVDDALHNLLVKRNQAYLSPVQASRMRFRTCATTRSRCWRVCGSHSNSCSPNSLPTGSRSSSAGGSRKAR